MYSLKYSKNVDEFLSSEPLARLDHKYLFIVLQDMQTFLHIKIHTHLCDPKESFNWERLNYDIEYYLTHNPNLILN